MYYPAPGHQHVKVLVPRATFPKVARMPAARAVPENPMAPLVRQALEASFGQRDPESLTGALFDMGVRSHVRYRRRLPLPAGHVREVTSHAREGGEDVRFCNPVFSSHLAEKYNGAATQYRYTGEHDNTHE